MNKTFNQVKTYEQELGSRIELVANMVGGKKELSKITGIPESGVYQYIKGESAITTKRIVMIAEAGNVSVSWLATGEGAMHADGVPSTADDVVLEKIGDQGAIDRNQAREQRVKGFITDVKATGLDIAQLFESKGLDIDQHWIHMLAGWVAKGKLDQQDVSDLGALIGSEINDSHPEHDYAYVTLYDAECSAGGGAWNESCRELTKIAFTKYSLRKKGLEAANLSAIRVSGDSMEGDLSDGDAVLVDHSKTDIRGEGIYVIRLDEHLYAKRLQRTFDGVEVISTNTAYNTITVPKDRLNELDVIGQVVWSASWMV